LAQQRDSKLLSNSRKTFGAEEHWETLKAALLKEKLEQGTVSWMTRRSSMRAMLRGLDFLYRKSYLK